MEVSDDMEINSLDCSLKVVDELPKLPQVALSIIRKARSRARGGGLRVAVVKTWNDKITVTKSDIKTLAPNNGLNNIIMDSYLELIGVRSKKENKEKGWPLVYVFRGCFYKKLLDHGYEAVREVTSSVNIFDFNLLLFPIHLIDHWGLAAVDFRIPSIKYYDSLGVEYPECFKVLKDYLSGECKNYNGKKQPSERRIRKLQAERVLNIPKQVNEYDCGVFACKYAEYLSRDAEFTFSQKDMKYYRRRMIYEIIAQKLM